MGILGLLVSAIVLALLGWGAAAAILRERVRMPAGLRVCGGGQQGEGCGYSLDGLGDRGVCPECGQEFSRAGFRVSRIVWRWDRGWIAAMVWALGCVIYVPPWPGYVLGYMVGRGWSIADSIAQTRRDLEGWPDDGPFFLALLNGWAMAVAWARLPHVGWWRPALATNVCGIVATWLVPAWRDNWSQGVIVADSNVHAWAGVAVGWVLVGAGAWRRGRKERAAPAGGSQERGAASAVQQSSENA